MNTKLRWPILLCYSFMLFSLSAHAQSFKTIGYLPYYRFSLIDEIDFTKVTHVNISFANPNLQGDLSVGGVDIKPVVQKAKEASVKVYLALAGAALTDNQVIAWRELLKTGNRADFVHKIIKYVIDHDLDGIDVDLEWDHVDENYSGFVLALRDSVNHYDLGLTAALPGNYRYPQITNQALLTFDWVNMMAYDLTGPWSPGNPGQHSPLEYAHSAIAFWNSQGVTNDRLTLGVPFYGYDFGNQDNVITRTYREMVNLDPENAYTDQVQDIYYNGIPTIMAKSQLALSELSGIMIWELGQDDFGNLSMLDKIWETVQSTVAVEELPDEMKVQVFPNPFHDWIKVEVPPGSGYFREIFDQHGRLVYTSKDSIIELINLSVPPGIYFLRLAGPKKIYIHKLVKSDI